MVSRPLLSAICGTSAARLLLSAFGKVGNSVRSPDYGPGLCGQFGAARQLDCPSLISAELTDGTSRTLALLGILFCPR
jgi:hypothetical protein